MALERLRIEMLLIKGESSKCNSIQTLKSLLASDGELHFKSKRIVVGKAEAVFLISTDLIEQETKERYFYINIEKPVNSKDEEKAIADLDAISKKLKQIIVEIGGKSFKIATLWDDTAYYYSKLAYPIIYEIENLMRKLIYQFMLTKLGSDWYKNATPEDFKRNIKSDRENPNLSFELILYNADFIHIINFLFGKYTVGDQSKVLEKINKAKSNSEIAIEELKQLVPQNNWTRYFQSIIAYEKFKEKWENLYALRCKVAHNTLITKGDYETIIHLAKELKEKLEKAISSLDRIKIQEEDKKELKQSALESFSETTGEFEPKSDEYFTAEPTLYRSLFSTKKKRGLKWMNHFNLNSACIYCSQPIEMENWEKGHVVCKSCNTLYSAIEKK
jgi:hypothetical protein